MPRKRGEKSRNEVVAVFDDWGLGYADGISSSGAPQKLLISEKDRLLRGFSSCRGHYFGRQ